MAKGGAIRWTPGMLDEYQRRTAKPTPAPTVAPAKRSKYRSQKVEQDGITFDSKKEARRWAELQAMQAEGRISGLQRQVAFELAPGVRLDGEARKKPALRYVADFVWMENGMQVVADCKSAPTRKLPAYRIKKHLLAVMGIQIKEL